MNKYPYPRALSFAVLILLIVWTALSCDLFDVSLVDYLKKEKETKSGNSEEEETPAEWVYLAVNTGDDNKSGWTEDQPVKTFGKALAIWDDRCSTESLTEARIMLIEDIKTSLGYNEILTNTETTLVDLSAALSTLSNTTTITTITFAGSGGGVTIDNNGFAGTTGAGRRVLSISAASNKTIILTNLTIKGGARATGSGGSLYNGGGIYIGNHSTVIMEDSVIIENNEAGQQGGGVYVEGDGSRFTMKGGEIRTNKATNINNALSNEQGGGVYVGSNGTFIMEGGTIKNNESDIDGGGVYVAGTQSTFTMKDGEISGNKSLNASGKGGGVCVEASGKFTMEGGTIKNNESEIEGGGVYVAGVNSNFTMKDGEISGNKARNTSGGKGGGVYVGPSGKFTMEEGAISKNESGNDGGGIYVVGANSKALIRNGAIGGADAANGNKAKYGAGIYVGASGRLELGTAAADLSYPVIQHNDASGTGGGIVINGSGANAFFYHGKVSKNTAGTMGGGILIVDGTLDMQGGTVTGNTATTGPGLTMEGGLLSMSAFARVNDQDNPIFMQTSNRKITITGGFLPQPISGDIAIIKISTLTTGYGSNYQILEESAAGYISTYHDKFKIDKGGGNYQSLNSDGKMP
jgi:hypothetical protein